MSRQQNLHIWYENIWRLSLLLNKPLNISWMYASKISLLLPFHRFILHNRANSHPAWNHGTTFAPCIFDEGLSGGFIYIRVRCFEPDWKPNVITYRSHNDHHSSCLFRELIIITWRSTLQLKQMYLLSAIMLDTTRRFYVSSFILQVAVNNLRFCLQLEKRFR